MNKIFNVPWLRDAGDLIGYISLRMEEPCGKSVPSSLFKALVFLETSAEVPPDRRISGSMALQHFLMEIERSDVWQPKTKTKAARWTVEMVLALEHIVMDKDKEKFKRVMAWYKLIKLWGALRSHDTEAIPPSTIKYEESHGLEAQIMRTKTTGAGRKVEVVHLFISSQAWLTYRGWLVEGLRIYKSMDDDQRLAATDFLMCLPTVDLQSYRKTMMRYPDAMVFSRTLFTELLAQRKNEFGNYERLMEPASSLFWSEHSERVTIISWASACGIGRPESCGVGGPPHWTRTMPPPRGS